MGTKPEGATHYNPITGNYYRCPQLGNIAQIWSPTDLVWLPDQFGIYASHLKRDPFVQIETFDDWFAKTFKHAIDSESRNYVSALQEGAEAAWNHLTQNG